MAGILSENLDQAQQYVDDCVHCGFCLDACPTYRLWAQEADSPRGRIVLIADAVRAGGEISEEAATHIDTCLGCLSCVTACPSGVRYDRLLELARPEVERRHERSGAERALRLLLFETLPYPRRMRALAPLLSASHRLGAERRLPERLAALLQVAPRPPSRQELRAQVPEHTPARGAVRGRVGLLLGCVQRVFFSSVHRATVEVLAAEGYEVLAPRLPDCCGALEFHSGELEPAVARARATVAAFGRLGQLDHVITNSAGCGSAMKAYGELLGTSEAREFAGRVRDITEVLAEAPPRAPRAPLPLRVVYHDACHLRHAQGIRDEPRAMLRAIPELELLEVPLEPEICCGSAGIYNLVAPEPAAALGRRKAKLVLSTGAEAVAAGNPGCAAQLERHLRELGHPLPVHHPIELVWRSIESAQLAGRGTVQPRPAPQAS
jgi:glycolate oxidase iron-sulfur subunit